MRPSALVAWLGAFGLALALAPASAAGAAPPEVVPLRVPSDRALSWFPPGTEVKSLSAAGFDRLVKAAREGVARRAENAPPKLLRASHSAIWEDGVLVGRSELVIDPPKSGAGVLVLEPWTPASEPGSGGTEGVRSDVAGRSLLRVRQASKDGGPVTAVVAWRLRARPGTGGRKFALGLPGLAACGLKLDVPEGLEPEGPTGLRQGPKPTGKAGRADWSFTGKVGVCDLSLIRVDGAADPLETPRLWVEGTTRLECNESAATWSLDWSAAAGPHPPRRLVVALDPGVEPLAVDGPDVEDFRTATDPDGSTLVTVRFRGRVGGVEAAPGATAATSLSIRGLARVPPEGPWVVPSARPVNAIWTGGKTTVRLDASHVLAAVRPLAGRQVAGPPGESAEERRLVFEAERTGPVAELLLRKPGADVSADVRGQLVVGNTSPRLNCRLTWRVDQGRPHTLDVELPRSWFADRVEIEGLGEPVAWHPEEMPGGGVRVHVTSPAGDWTARPLVLNLWATSSVAGGRGPLTLPRVRPVGARTADEVWVARVEAGVTLRPTRAKGLAWIDPAVAANADPQVNGARPALAWRWTSEDGAAQVERERSEAVPRGSVTTVATLTRGHIDLDALVTILAPDEPVKALTLGLSEPVADPDRWRFVDPTTGLELSRKPLDAKGRADAGGLGNGPAWSVELPHPQRGRVALRARYEGRREGRGRLPLPLLPAALRAKGTVLVLARRDVRTSSVVRKVRALDPEVTAESLAAEGGSGVETGSALGLPAYRRALAFTYESPDARIELRTETLSPAAGGGVVREAVLRTQVDPGGEPGRRRLTLKIAPGHSPSLEVTLPPDTTLERVRLDGAPVLPTRSGAVLSIPLNGPGPTRPLVVVALEYRRTGPPPADRVVARPDRPEFSLPCLSLVWEVVLPERWAVADWGPALTPADPATTRPGLLDRLAVGRSRWAWDLRWRRPSARHAAAAEALRGLNQRVNADRAGDASLGDWFTRWDAGPWPVLIDREAIFRLGLGPRSRSLPRPGDDTRPLTASELLRPLGLDVVAEGRTLLVTTRAEASGLARNGREARNRWQTALDEAAAWGADASDRFQSVSRWREDVTPRAPATVEAAEADPDEGRVVMRFIASGWPDSGAEVRLIDRQAQAAAGWTVAFLVLSLGLALRGLSRAARAAGTATLLGLALLATAEAPPDFSGPATGLAGGAIGLAFFGLGESLPGPSALRARLRWASTARRPVAGVSHPATPIVLALAAAAVASAAPWALAQPRLVIADGAGGPIYALFPFDGVPDPSKPPDRVILRLQDDDRLRSLADETGKTPPPALEATEARHRVVWRDRSVVSVETDLTLAAEGQGLARWSFPVEEAREIAATLDGAEAPVRIEPGGRLATVQIDLGGAGSGDGKTYRLSLRRTVVPQRAPSGESIALAVNRICSARFEVDDHPSGLRAEVPCARGLDVRRDGHDGREGQLGPSDRLEARWPPAGGAKAVAPAGAVEGLYLWDVSPAGDRVRARLTYRNPGGTSLLRVGLGPGTVVREAKIPGTVDATREGTAEHPEWVARVDPPLPDGSTIMLDVWRPRPPAGSVENVGAGPTTRTVPRVEPMGLDRSTGMLAFRRPADWVGRLTTGAGAEAVGDEAFVRAWEARPGDPLTLSGVVKLPSPASRTALPQVETGPRPPRLRVAPTVQMTVSAGRIDLVTEAELAETAASVYETQMSCPPGFRVARVSADGLTHWERPEGGPLVLRFDGPPLRQRKLRVVGWLAVADDPLVLSRSSRELVVPWPRWFGQDEQPGTLTVVAPSPIQLIPSSTAADGPAETPGPAPPTGPPYRMTHRVNRPDDPGRVRWEVEPPRVAVLVRSQLTIDPESAGWVAEIRYDVSGGPLDAINLRLPTDWARAASVGFAGAGVSHQQVTETRGETTYWSLRPERPVWGSQRLVVRSSIPFVRGEARAFPDLDPLGWGRVETYLTIVNATRRAISVEGSSALKPVAAQATDPDDELAASAPRTAPATTYRVVKDPWTLRIQKPGDRTPEGSDPDAPRPERAEVSCTLAADGTVLGIGRYEVGPRSGPFLGVEMRPGSAPLWASVNGTPAPPLKAGPGRWQVPLAEESVSRLALVWRSDPPVAAAGGPQPIALPVVGRGRLPAVVTVHAPPGVEVVSPRGRLSPSDVDRVELEKAGWLARQTAESLTGLDRGARRDGEDLVAALVRFEFLLRQAERAAARNLSATPAERESRAAQIKIVSQIFRARLSEAVRNEALDEFEAAAMTHLGLKAGAPSAPTVPTPPQALAVDVRPLGRPHEFQGELGGTGDQPWLVWSARPRPESSLSPIRWLPFGLLASAPPITWLSARRARSKWLARLTLAAAMALVAVWSGPVLLAALLGLAAIGRLSRA